jgi:delta14-sterol reductase
MDITTDGFGFMLAFGDLVFVPFTYGLQARYLAFNPIDLGLPACAAIIAVKLLGVWAFKGANIEKFDFRNGRNPKSALFRTQMGRTRLTIRPAVHGDAAGNKTSDVGMVGRFASPGTRHLPALRMYELTRRTTSATCSLGEEMKAAASADGSLSWSLPTGFNTPITYFYFVYFIILLVHRQKRDDHACKQKYGKDWDEYCRRVPYKICPWLVSRDVT